jgi:uncharacterized protein (UPF0303 family)
MNEPVESDIEKVEKQESQLIFKVFNEDVAWELGVALRSEAQKFSQGVVIDIRANDEILFFSAMAGTSPDNSNWARRKRNLVNLLGISSYLVGLRVKFQDDSELIADLEESNYAWHGGCFPIKVAGQGIVATATISGLPQRADHKLVTDVIAKFLSIDLGENSL